MTIDRPYRRTVRQLVDGNYARNGQGRYVSHPKFAQDAAMYVRAFLLLQKDVQEIFDYIEPADKNLNTYSFRTHALLLRSFIEVEANFKAILQENGYSKKRDLNMDGYKKLEASHHLSSYKVKIPYWRGVESIRQPFVEFAQSNPLAWYQAYNATKHDRHASFEEATFKNSLDAICGLLVLLSAQFRDEDFSPTNSALMVGGPEDGFDSAIGEFFRVKFPDDWAPSDRYDFDWESLSKESDPFQNYAY